MGYVGLISWVLFGFIVGILAKLLMPGKDPGGCIVTTLIGIAGAVLGGMLASVLDFGGYAVFDWRSLVLAILCSVLLLAVYRGIKGRSV
jgi:uncharacterized membrane protein YeaQ/YmgE (transglycosylase-associated protein family)